MDGVRDPRGARLPRPGRLARLGAAGLLCSLAWAGLTAAARAQDPPARAARLAEPVPLDEPARPQAAEVLPAPAEAPAAGQAGPEAAGKVVPINLDAVLHLAQDQNVQINLAREKLQEAYADKALADKGWLPELLVGPSYYRHEGGIADEQGRLIHSSFGSFFGGLEMDARLDPREVVYRKVDAERRVWQQKGEVSRMTSENLLDAATTYVDLLSARSAEAIALEVQANLGRLLDKAKRQAATDPGVRVEVDRVAAEMAGQRQILRKVREGAASASARLAYLLGLDPCTQLVPTEPRLVPVRFVDPSRPCCDLVAQAQASGPGVREMEGLLNLIQSAMAKAQGPGRFMPSAELRVAEGVFGTGPGDDSRWDNRLDLGLSVRWNLTQLLTARERSRQAQAKLNQAQLSYQDLRGRLAMGVQTAREASLSDDEQMREAEAQIQSARAAYKLSEFRLNENVKGSSPSEVLLSARSLGGAQLNYLEAVRDYNKAQLRLMILLGGADGAPCPK